MNKVIDADKLRKQITEKYLDILKVIDEASDLSQKECLPIDSKDGAKWMAQHLSMQENIHLDNIKVFTPSPGTYIEEAAKQIVKYQQKTNEEILLRFNGIFIPVKNNTVENIIYNYYQNLKAAKLSEDDEARLNTYDYWLGGQETRVCPKCGEYMLINGYVCPGCGYDDSDYEE